MKTLYLQCNMGIAGDMMAAALYELLEDQEDFLAVANQLLPQVSVTAEPAEKQGIRGTHLAVRVNGSEEEQGIADHHHSEHHHHHASLSHIRSILSGLPVSQHVKEQAAQVYDFLAHAEAKAHGCPVDQIHFHEVGELDAIADITLACLALELLNVEQVICSPVCTGFGQVRCAHGTLPVPAPATAWLLEGIPAYAGTVEGELTTPTGAALVSVLADRFEQMPLMVTRKLGYGMGKKDFPQAANCVRAFLGETREQSDTVTELVCSIDDMTGCDHCSRRDEKGETRPFADRPFRRRAGRTTGRCRFTGDYNQRSSAPHLPETHSDALCHRENISLWPCPHQAGGGTQCSPRKAGI